MDGQMDCNIASKQKSREHQIFSKENEIIRIVNLI